MMEGKPRRHEGHKDGRQSAWWREKRNNKLVIFVSFVFLCGLVLKTEKDSGG
jgi:hypothetical protein